MTEQGSVAIHCPPPDCSSFFYPLPYLSPPPLSQFPTAALTWLAERSTVPKERLG